MRAKFLCVCILQSHLCLQGNVFTMSAQCKCVFSYQWWGQWRVLVKKIKYSGVKLGCTMAYNHFEVQLVQLGMNSFVPLNQLNHIRFVLLLCVEDWS